MAAAMKPKPPSRDDRRMESRLGKGRSESRQPAEEAAIQPVSPWSTRRRAIASVLIILHVAAVFAAPCAGPPPSSPLERNVANVFDPYLQAAFLNHGYRFFAPNPGPSHLVRYELTLADGKTNVGRFPDLKTARPRLLYHRHFMLSETIFSLTRTLTDPPRFTSTEQHEAYERDVKAAKELVGPLLTAVAKELREEHDATRVKLFVVQHDIPTPEQVLDGMKLTDESLYREQPLGELTAEGEWQWADKLNEPGVEVLP
jgi:hypothetical protein